MSMKQVNITLGRLQLFASESTWAARALTRPIRPMSGRWPNGGQQP